MKPILVIVSGPPGSGKTTLAHALGHAIPCPVVSRDAIKEGMVHAHGGDFTAAPGDPLTARTFTLFADVLRVLLTAGVTVVAEAAFQDKAWRRILEPFAELAEVRIVHCKVDPTVARERIERRMNEPARAAHADRDLLNELDGGAQSLDSFDAVSFPAPSIEVDTTDGFAPGVADILDFIEHARA